MVAGTTGGLLKYLNGVQDAGVLDDLFYYSGQLGAVFSNGQLTINLWAPTAQSVKLLLYAHENDATPAQTLPMTETNGVWTVKGQSSWKGQYYLYDLFVYVPNQQQIVENIVTDPYSADIALNGTKTRITDLSDESTKPAGWDASFFAGARFVERFLSLRAARPLIQCRRYQRSRRISRNLSRVHQSQATMA